MVLRIKLLLAMQAVLLTWFCSVSGAAIAADEEKPSVKPDEPVYARVNGRAILANDFDKLYSATIRQRFYHGKVQDGELDVVRKEVLETLIDRSLMLEDAERRGLKPDDVKIDQEIAGYDARYAKSEMWKTQRDQLLPGVRSQLAKQSLIEQIEKLYRAIPSPSALDVKAYYDQHHELFTEPEKLRLSLILLKVDPSAPKTVWDQAREEGMAILQRIRKGADFSEMARLHSSDQSGARGGDVGYVHRGMLPEGIHEKMDKAVIGEVSEPITTLEGVALVRLDERVVPKLRDFPDVETRARELLVRDLEGQAAKSALAQLRAVAKIEVLAPVAGDTKAQ